MASAAVALCQATPAFAAGSGALDDGPMTGWRPEVDGLTNVSDVTVPPVLNRSTLAAGTDQ